MKTAKIKYFMFVLFVIILFIIIAPVLHSWLTDIRDNFSDGITSNLKMNYKIWFDQDNNNHFTEGIDIDAQDYYLNSGDKPLKILKISAGDSNAINYFGKLRIKIDIITNSDYYIRVKFNNKWFRRQTVKETGQVRDSTINLTGDNLMPYGLNGNWYYDSSSNFVYYKNIISDNIVLELVDSPSLSDYTDYNNPHSIFEYFVHLDVLIEVVQKNRVKQIWGLEEIPTGN